MPRCVWMYSRDGSASRSLARKVLMWVSTVRSLLRAMPWVFVLIWSTGFVVARLGMPHAPPMSFLALRFALSVACFVTWMAIARVPWPPREQWMQLAVSGVLMHAGYLGGVWSAVKAGIGAGTVSLLVGLQPVLTAIWLSATAAPRAQGRVQRIGKLLAIQQAADLQVVCAGDNDAFGFGFVAGHLAQYAPGPPGAMRIQGAPHGPCQPISATNRPASPMDAD